jgi:putative ABC transport system substrate-binding protein
LAIAAMVVAAARPARADGVVILVEGGIAQYNETLSAMRSRLHEQIATINIDSVSDPVGEVRRAHPHAVVAIGQKALALVARTLTDVPIVYCSVLYPEQHGLTGANITGVPLEIPPAKQFERFREVAPRVKRIGVIHSQAVTAIVAEASAAAGKLGLRIVARSIASPREVAEAFSELSGQIDALWLLPDSKVMNKEVFNYLLRTSLDANIALFGFIDGLTQAGALASISPDYQDIGARAADLVAQTVEHGRSGVPPKMYSRGALSVNLKTAQRLGIGVDEHTLQGAQRVFR